MLARKGPVAALDGREQQPGRPRPRLRFAGSHLEARKVLLFSPPYAGKLFGPPLGLLSLAASLREAGYAPVIIDGALDRDYLKRIAEQAADCRCLGVSLLTGPMIRDAIEAGKRFRALRPDAPIIFGGWHPSLRTAETLREDFVDIVVRHQGERTLVEILQRIEAGRDLDLVAGCWFKRDGQIRMNPDRPAVPLPELPSPAYDLANFGAYENSSGERKLPYATSIGCPYACNYCTDMVFYNRRFNALDAARVVDEMMSLAERHRLTEVALVDSNFLVDVHRAAAIAEGLVRRGARFKWSFQTSTDLLCRLTDEQVELLGASGVKHIGFGTESGSPEVLERMNKRHQRIEDIGEAARKCERAGIRVTLNLIFAYPGEEECDRRKTLRVMGEIAARHRNVTFSPNVFTPYPGIPIWPELIERGLREPKTLAEWADIDLGANNLPWLRGRPFGRLRRGIAYFLLANELNKACWAARSTVARRALSLLGRPLNWRLRNYFFALPWELGLSMARTWLTVRRSLLTGQPLSRELSGEA
jgi:anaerobic magnesium-protoporphyrin IX monomethyl ester cyclase